jgi:hypothetical protein
VGGRCRGRVLLLSRPRSPAGVALRHII